jgi:transcriptional regulator with XRE-family HTH domain
MGKQIRRRPERLPGKLLEIRRQLGLSQNEMVRHLGLTGEIERDYVSKFERGTLEPTLHVLLRYARAANVFVDALIDDELELPATLPASVKSGGVGTKLRPRRHAKGQKGR